MLLDKLKSIEGINKHWKSPRKFSPFRWVRDLFSKGLYSEFNSVPYIQLLRNRDTILEFGRQKKEMFIQTLDADRESLNSSWTSLISEVQSLYMRSLKIDHILKLDGVGLATLNKLKRLGIDNMQSLQENSSEISRLEGVPMHTKRAIEDYLNLCVDYSRELRPVRDLNNPMVQGMLIVCNRYDRNYQEKEHLEHVTDSLEHVLISLPEVEFSSFKKTRSLQIDTNSLNEKTKLLLKVCQRLEKINPEQSKSFDELSNDEFIRANNQLESYFEWDSKRSKQHSSSTSAKPVRQGENDSTNQSKLSTSFGNRGFNQRAELLPDLPKNLSNLLSFRNLDPDLVRNIEAEKLDLSGLKNCVLRRYQLFGTKFLKVAKHTLLGDEMGLGKTIQALSFLCDLAANSNDGFTAIVVVPANLRENWRREITSKSVLTPIVIGSTYRLGDWQFWLKHGGIAIVSYSSLRSDIEWLLPKIDNLSCLIADEAHYIKNLGSGRTQATRRLTALSQYTAMMTGTPVENKPLEMVRIVNATNHSIKELRQMESSERVFQPDVFKDTVMSLYLRRNKDDVLDELPEVSITEEWVELPETELEAHLDLLDQGKNGNYLAVLMKLRQHAIFGSDPDTSEKIKRIIELASFHTSERKNVVIFTYFKQAIASIRNAFPNSLEISGSIPASQRQNIIDQLNASKGQILVSQINVGGLGLNMQGASVAIIVEPQYNPAIEDQAISRLHRMGQRYNVQVHKIYAKDTIEERIHEMLAKKRGFIRDYSQDSALKHQSKEAISKEEALEMLEVQRVKLEERLAS